MKAKELLAVLGSIVLLVGVFTPIVSVPIVGSLNYFQNGKGDGIFILALAAISLVLAVTSHYEGLWLTGGGSLAVLTFTFVQFQLMRHEIVSAMDKDLADNPFAGLARSAVDAVQIQWGWALLLVGVGMVLAGAVLQDERTSAKPFFSLPTKTLAIMGLVAVVAVGTWGAAQISHHRSLQSDQTKPPTTDSKQTKGTDHTSSEANQYLAKLEVSQVKGGMSKGTLTCYDHECPAVWGKIKNTGDRTVSRVVVTAYFPDSTGKVVFEKEYPALSTGALMNNDSPLRPGYIKEFGYVVKDCPSECVPESVRVSVTGVELIDGRASDPHQ